MDKITQELRTPLVDLLFSIADDKLMLGHRNADWTGLGPILEEDIAFSAIAQDELAHAQVLYEFIAALTTQDADALAYGRQANEYRCAALIEVADDYDYAKAILRQFFCAHFNALRLDRLARSNHPPLSALATRMRAEEQIHLEHSNGWIHRLGMGGAESRARLQAALENFGPLAASLCQTTSGHTQLESSGLYPGNCAQMNHRFLTDGSGSLSECGLKSPAGAFELTAVPPQGGRTGQHSPVFDELLAELREVYQVEPNAKW